ncbi:BglG family transcription antiterminator [uncultured Vagococcus sp.]|uniref:BglG family transcription antiterminator n=1 Tax=uncultured Vagococcus sp. TaxID=189676 RepID=UPI0028D89015|nr:BglG family transcription antiterminator [uncultured Vagococcus sp.]
MNNREKKVFLSLIHQQAYVTITDLAELHEVSTRSIYNDLAQIDLFLKENGIPQLNRTKGKGIRYLADKQLFNHIIQLLENGQSDYLEPAIRRSRLLALLLFKHGYVTIDELSNHFRVSRNTIVNDLQEVKPFFQDKELSLDSYPYQGLIVQGKELAKRRAMVSLYVDNLGGNFQESKTVLASFVSQDELAHLDLLLSEIETELNFRFTDVSYEEFRLYVAMAIARNRQQKSQGIELQMAELSISKEYEIISILSHKLTQLCDVHFSIGEINYLTLQLMSSSIHADMTQNGLIDIWVPLQIGTYEFLQGVAADIGTYLLKDQSLFQGLLAHLRPAYYRMIAKERVANPMLEQIRQSYKDIHASVLVNVKWLELQLNVGFNDDEISFLTMYIAGAVERQKNYKRVKPRVLIVCSSGISTSQILASQIETLFDMTLIGSYSSRDVDRILDKYEIDLIISTVDLQRDHVQVVKVSPILVNKDIQRLKQVMMAIDTEVDLDRILSIIDRNAQITKRDQLEVELKAYLQPNPDKPRYKGVRDPMLIEVLNEALIAVNQPITDKEGAVRKCGQLLFQQDLVEETYIDAMIDNLRENGNYIVIAPGIAMPHARPEYGAKDIGFSLVTLAEPVVFGHPTNDPVQIIFGLCAVDHQSHLQALSELVDILGNQNNVKRILAATTPAEVMTIIKEDV